MELNVIKGISAAILTGVTYFLGDWSFSIQALVVLIAIDYITGLLSAWYNKEVSSQKGFRGIAKKGMYLGIVVIANIVDILMKADGWIREACIYFFIANEGISIIENAAKCGVITNKTLLNKLKQLRDDNDTKDGD